MIFPVCPVISRSGSRKNHVNPPGLGRSVWIQLGNSGLSLLGGDPGNAILLNGVTQTANLEIGAPGFQPQAPKSTSEFRLRGDGFMAVRNVPAPVGLFPQNASA